MWRAPVYADQVVGTVTLSLDGQQLAAYNIRAKTEVPRMTVGTAYGRLLTALIANRRCSGYLPRTASLHNGESPAPSKGIHK